MLAISFASCWLNSMKEEHDKWGKFKHIFTSWLHVVMKSLYRCLSNSTSTSPPQKKEILPPLSIMIFSRYTCPRFLSFIFILGVIIHSLSQQVTSSKVGAKANNGVLGLQIAIAIPSVYEVLHNFLKACSQSLQYLILTVPRMVHTLATQGFSWISCCDQNRWVGGGWGEGGPREREYMYIYSWFTLLYSRNWHSIVKQLYTNLKKNVLFHICTSKAEERKV